MENEEMRRTKRKETCRLSGHFLVFKNETFAVLSSLSHTVRAQQLVYTLKQVK